ncbi:RNB domain-containing ribonuclease [Leucobacter sp. CSA1]|uniref:RNB domain-containing ribonuclease n=1 Tax=Leucobacter chromiisoli TaxID=2796471 RepID=A0A934UU40_9MICO|nr:RNB domain-containing ribonuclease [Leucobacter chromiisoli]MBK0418415.1 RNB domain-containing ribonuclease [Leucobacter chromiisoli]
MPQRHLSLTRDPRVASERASLEARLSELRGELDLPEGFSPEALAEAESAAVEPPGLDLREIPFTTLDPAGSRDLDQAFHLERAGSGFAVRYAIADVPGFVRPGGAVDAEARRRGQTIYLPDGSIPLHPRTLSEGRASLLAGEDRPALVWTIELDAAGAQTSARVERALVRSREQRDYAGAQAEIDAGRHDEQLELLRVVGELRIGQERARGGASLPMPEEEVVVDPDDGYRIERRSPLPVEEWNAQLSLLTGMAAAGIMLSGGVGILRTMPAPDEASLARFRAEVAEIGSPWAAGVRYGDYLRGVDPAAPRGMEILEAATSLFRGAGYTPFDGAIPELTTQAALAAPYAHVTAPLRRLVDRWGLAICLALCEGDEVPDWVRSSLADLPALMRAAGQRASRAEGAAIDLVEEACAASASRAA